MTRVDIHFDLAQPLDDALLTRIAEAHKIFGLLRVRVGEESKKINVEYDASRLTPAQVQSALHRAGIPTIAHA